MTRTDPDLSILFCEHCFLHLEIVVACLTAGELLPSGRIWVSDELHYQALALRGEVNRNGEPYRLCSTVEGAFSQFLDLARRFPRLRAKADGILADYLNLVYEQA